MSIISETKKNLKRTYNNKAWLTDRIQNPTKNMNYELKRLIFVRKDKKNDLKWQLNKVWNCYFIFWLQSLKVFDVFNLFDA